MKLRTILSVLLAVVLTGVASARTGWTKEQLSTLENALKDPATVHSLVLDCKTKDAEKFMKAAPGFVVLQTMVLKGGGTGTDWKRLLSVLSTLPSLETIEFTNNGFEKVPDGLEKLTQIHSLAISDNDDMDLGGLGSVLALMPRIDQLSLEVYSVNELPPGISAMSDLKKLLVFNKEVIFGDEDSKDKTEERLKAESDFNIDWIDGKNEKRELAMNYFTIGESISPEEMNALNKLFPNAEQQNNDKDQSRTQIGFEKKYAFVKPPIPGVDVEKEYFVVDADKGGDFTYNSGTHVVIPPFAFVQKDGRPVNGEVTIDYREFRDQADILASGIPMTYDSGGVLNNFESAGMLEINASQNGKELTLKGDKQISMDFSSTDDRSSFNLYAFNDTTGNWNLLGKAGAITKQVQPISSGQSGAYIVFRNYLEYNRVIGYDSTLFADRFEPMKYKYTDRDSLKKRRRFYIQGDEYTSWLVKPVSPKAVDGKVIFSLKYFPIKHPELNCFSGVKWTTEDDMSASAFKKQFSFKNYYSDIRIVDEGGSYSMEFKGLKGVQKLEVKPVFMGQDNKVRVLKDNGRQRFKRYFRVLGSREKRFNKLLKKGKLEDNKITVTDPEEMKRYAFNEARKTMNAKELAMNFDQWMVYYKDILIHEVDKVNNGEVTQENIIRSFTLSGMGIYNCDQVRRISDPIFVNGKYQKNGSEEVINAPNVYVVDKNKKSVFSYAGNGEIIFGRHATNVLLTIDMNGMVAVFTADQFKNETFKNKEHHTFNMMDASKINSVGELRKLMGLKG